MRILLIEDSTVMIELLTELLTSGGHEIVGTADCLVDALAAYKTHKPDMVTLDLSLPKENGLTILKALRQDDPQAKVMVITGNTQKGVHKTVMQAGAACIMSKPLASAELLAALTKMATP